MKRIAEELAEIYSAKMNADRPVCWKWKFNLMTLQRGNGKLDERTWDPYWLYWKSQLSGERVNLELPLRVPPCGPHYKSAIHKFSIPAKTVESINALCARTQVDRFEVFLPVFTRSCIVIRDRKTFLSAYRTRSSDARTEMTVGPISNLLALAAGPAIRASTTAFVRGQEQTPGQ